MEAEDLDRYKELLLAKRRELLAARSSNLVLAPPGDESRGDLGEQASAEAEAKFKSACARPEVIYCKRSTRP